LYTWEPLYLQEINPKTLPGSSCVFLNKNKKSDPYPGGCIKLKKKNETPEHEFLSKVENRPTMV
jgi:hypothetical protein